MVKVAVITWNEAAGDVGDFNTAMGQLVADAQLKTKDVIVYHYQESSLDSEKSGPALLNNQLGDGFAVLPSSENCYFRATKGVTGAGRKFANVGTMVFYNSRVISEENVLFDIKAKVQDSDCWVKTANFGGHVSRLTIGDEKNPFIVSLTGCHLSSHNKAHRHQQSLEFHKLCYGDMAPWYNYNQISKKATNGEIFSGDFNQRDYFRADRTNAGSPVPSAVFAQAESGSDDPTYVAKDVECREESVSESMKEDPKRPGLCKGGRLDGHYHRLDSKGVGYSESKPYFVGGSDHAPVVLDLDLNLENAASPEQRLKNFVWRLVARHTQSKNLREQFFDGEFSTENIELLYHYFRMMTQIKIELTDRFSDDKDPESQKAFTEVNILLGDLSRVFDEGIYNPRERLNQAEKTLNQAINLPILKAHRGCSFFGCSDTQTVKRLKQALEVVRESKKRCVADQAGQAVMEPKCLLKVAEAYVSDGFISSAGSVAADASTDFGCVAADDADVDAAGVTAARQKAEKPAAAGLFADGCTRLVAIADACELAEGQNAGVTAKKLEDPLAAVHRFARCTPAPLVRAC